MQILELPQPSGADPAFRNGSGHQLTPRGLDRARENPDALHVLLACEASPPAADDLGERDDLSHRPDCYHGRRGVGNVESPPALRRSTLAAKSDTVRLVCFGDIHMAFHAVERLAATLREADCAILVGDLTNFGDPPDAFRVVDAVRAHCPNVLAVTGNLDMPQVIDAFRAEGISLHGEGRRLGPVGIFGCGGSNVTPMDTPTELEEDDIRATLERGHEAVADAPLRLMVCHTPPFDTRLDRLVNGRPVGSPAVRAFIETHRPHVAVVGHIHEGRGIDRVGDTMVANGGALRDGGYLVVTDDADGLHVELRNFRSAAA